MFISHSLLKFDLRENYLSSFCRTNKVREIPEAYIIVLDAIHQPFPTLTAGSGRTVGGMIVVLRHGRGTESDQRRGQKNTS